MSIDLKNPNNLGEPKDGNIPASLKTPEFEENMTAGFDLSEMSGMSRKQFLALLAASAAFGMAGCSNYRDKGEIVPYTKKPEEVTPVIPNYYASTCIGCSQACGILIKTREGRPIKVDGNPDHPVNQGKICAVGQASILNLYDPYRLRKPKSGKSISNDYKLKWADIDAEMIHRLELAVKNGKEIAIVARAVNSPTTKRVLDDFKAKYPTTKVYSYSVFNNENKRQAWQKCYDSFELPVIELDKAKIILALEADFLGTDGMVMEQIRLFTSGRDVMKSNNFNRLYCVESSISITGSNADYRFRLHPGLLFEFVWMLTERIEGKNSSDNILKEFAIKYGLSYKALISLADDLESNRGEAIVYAGNGLPEEVHIAVNYLNNILGGPKLYSKKYALIDIFPLSTPQDIDSLVNKMKAGLVDVLLHFDSNPVYHLPKEFGYESAMRSVPLTISLVEAEDETSQSCTYVLPIHHAFESWGDYKVRSGIISLQQPVIAPLYDTRQKEAALLNWMMGGDTFRETIYYEYLMNRWEKEIYPNLKLRTDFKKFWHSALHDGMVEFDEPVKTRVNGKIFKARIPVPRQPTSPEGSVSTIVLTQSYFIGDGSFANNGWLQELPHPITKIVWDNYAAISPLSAGSLGVNNNDMVQINLGHGSVILPVFLQPGQADGVVSVSLGYGRTHAGPVGSNIGVNASELLSKESLNGTRVFNDAQIRKAKGNYELVATQEHHSLNGEFLKDLHIKRRIIQEGTLLEYEKNQNFLHEKKTDLFNITPEIEYHGIKWAMAIDLNKCIGCNACVAGCNVENNIPVVGKEQASKGRTMQWIRIDRYYSGSNSEPLLSHQPMLCQQCDNAPCENVCPVVATNHSPDGLNQMVYNRCVGTKYCSNNCPYKVRRFNFYNWRISFADGYYEEQPVNLVYNPEVTVRSRGVMEKCTFCIQRIMEARQHAIEQRREIKGSDVKTACQEACPATAIVFGDMNDPESNITNYRTHKLAYHVLEEINVRPNVTYMVKLRNVKPENQG